jgi:hypothetical protein
MYKFENEIVVQVHSGETGELLHEWKKPNAISDDLLAEDGYIFFGPAAINTVSGNPICFLLPDDPSVYPGTPNVNLWTSGAWAAQGSVFNRQNPWAPYCNTVNNYVDNSAEPYWKGPFSCLFLASDNLTSLPTPTGIPGRTQLKYIWGQAGGLQGAGLQMKALGLTAWETDYENNVFGAPSSSGVPVPVPSIFIPFTLVVLPTSIFIHGRNGGTTVPDVLTIIYYLSIIGAS